MNETQVSVQARTAKVGKVKMARFMALVSMLSIVLLRKCIHIYNEYAHLLLDMAFVLVSSVRFSGLRFRSTEAVSGRISPMTSMMGRPDRQYYLSTYFSIYVFFLPFFFPTKIKIHGDQFDSKVFLWFNLLLLFLICLFLYVNCMMQCYLIFELL